MYGQNNIQPYTVVSFVYKIINYTSNCIYLIDGSMDDQGIQTLEPLLGTGGANNAIPANFLGHIMLFRSKLLENNTVEWDGQSYEILATPPPIAGPELKNWYMCVPHYNMVLMGDAVLAENYFNRYGTYYKHINDTDFGARFANSLNYGILNCTSKILYQVDDTAHYNNKHSDIYELKNGNDIMFPLWGQQEANNAHNLDSNKEYIRIYRYGGRYNADDEFNKCMRETIIYWDKSALNDEGFLYVPSHQVCLFDTKNKAQWFLNTYHSIELYQRTKLVEELEKTLKLRYKEYEADLKAKNDTVIKGCGIFVGLTIAWKLGELVIEDMKKHPKEPLPPPLLPTEDSIFAKFTFTSMFNTVLDTNFYIDIPLLQYIPF
jgi:hypothetical protein